MLSNDVPLKVSQYPNSPFKKVLNQPQPIPKYNFYNDSRQTFHPNTSHEKYIQPPVQFGVNVYFGQPKMGYNPNPMYQTHPPIPEYFSQNNQEHIPVCILFKNSLAKSGYKLTPEQSVLYKDTYKKHNSINSFYDSFNYYPINNSNNIINNIYPTFTKVTNVQILSDAENAKINEKENEIKKENINSINTNNKINIKNFTKLKKDENANINIYINNDSNNTNTNDNSSKTNSSKKVLFECSETNALNNINNNKNLLKKKRLRKNNQQLGLLSKFYTENKNWTKKQIKEISESIGLKENKIYKWLWDQKNKEYKATKFVVNK